MTNLDKVGVRLYGQRWGLTPIDACKASSLVVPIGHNTSEYISDTLSKYSPKGMTPITYSLKQAVKHDFKPDGSNKHIILITDGGENCDESPCTYVMELVKHRKDIKIDVIALNIDDEDDLDQLRCSATVTSGKLYNATTEAELLQGLNNIFNAEKHVDARIMY
jgi:Ca-activated chloride channel family protein